MTDTTHDSKLDRIRWITDELARINCGKVPGVTIFLEDELRSELHQLNIEFGRQMRAAFSRYHAPSVFQGVSGKILAGCGGALLFAAGVTLLVIMLGIILQGFAASAYPAR